jgi:hypothetical protein
MTKKILQGKYPLILFDGLNESLALQIKKQFEKAGAKIDIVETNTETPMVLYDAELKRPRCCFPWTTSWR